MPSSRLIGALALLLALSLAAAPTAQARYRTYAPPSATLVPPGFTTNADQAYAIARATGPVRAATARAGRLTAQLFYDNQKTWHVRFASPQHGREAEVVVDGPTGRVLHVWTGYKLDDIARGANGRIGRDLGAAPLVLLALAALFAAPFVDPRRPFRSTHLDVALLLMFLIPYELWRLEKLTAAYVAVFVLLAALVVRLATRRAQEERVVPFASAKLLLVAIGLLVAVRLAINIADADTSDIGVGTLGGATRLLHGQQIYARGGSEYDTYGPAAYLIYGPFALLWPLGNLSAYNPFGVHVAALVVDACTGGALFALGRRFTRSTLGGAAAAYGWFAYPFTTLTLTINANDALVALTVVGAIAALASAPLAGAAVGLAGATKFAPLALAPLHAGVAGGHERTRTAKFALGFLAVVCALLSLTLPPGGLSEFYDVTIGLQDARDSVLSFWHVVHIDLLRTITMAVTCGFVLSLFAVRPDIGRARVAALGAAAIYSTQLPLTYWFFTYTVWALPLALLALTAGETGFRPLRAPPARAAAT